MIKLKQKLFIIFFIFSLTFLPVMNKAEIDNHGVEIIYLTNLAISMLVIHHVLEKYNSDLLRFVIISSFIVSTGLLLKNYLKKQDNDHTLNV